MNRATRHRMPMAFLLSLLAVGVPYWLIPYNKLNLPDALIGPGLLVIGGAALLLRLYARAPFWRVVAVIGTAAPAAVLVRVVWDGLADPTSHNLWPLELVIAFLVGFACALAGAIAGSLMSMVAQKLSGTGKP